MLEHHLETPIAPELHDAVQFHPNHPLEPLTAKEIESAVELLRTVPSCTAATRIISIILREPSKELVYAWPSGPAPHREAVGFYSTMPRMKSHRSF